MGPHVGRYFNWAGRLRDGQLIDRFFCVYIRGGREQVSEHSKQNSQLNSILFQREILDKFMNRGISASGCDAAHCSWSTSAPNILCLMLALGYSHRQYSVDSASPLQHLTIANNFDEWIGRESPVFTVKHIFTLRIDNCQFVFVWFRYTTVHSIYLKKKHIKLVRKSTNST